MNMMLGFLDDLKSDLQAKTKQAESCNESAAQFIEGWKREAIISLSEFEFG
jgi:hypothetical protein